MAYWAGFIAADGCIMDNMVRIKLQSQDRDHLVRFANDCGFTGPVYDRDSYVSLGVYGVPYWVSDLKTRFNITPRKTSTLLPPNSLTREQTIAFIVGLVDGDGCISYDTNNHTHRLDICGTESMMRWVQDSMRAVCPEVCNATVRFYSSGLARWTMAARACRWLNDYAKELDLPVLSRKWNKLAGGDV